MFSIFKSDPIKKLKKAHAKKLEEAMHAQRNGDMRSFATITNEAEALKQKIQKLQQESVKKLRFILPHTSLPFQLQH
jgi:hypothetical protein